MKSTFKQILKSTDIVKLLARIEIAITDKIVRKIFIFNLEFFVIS